MCLQRTFSPLANFEHDMFGQSVLVHKSRGIYVEVKETISAIEKLEKSREALFMAKQSKSSKELVEISDKSKVENGEIMRGCLMMRTT